MELKKKLQEINEINENKNESGENTMEESVVEEIKNKIKILTKKQLNSSKKASKIRYSIGDKVRLKNGNIGIIRFSHKTFFSNNQIMYGIKLNEWNPNGHTGSYENISYFECEQGYGFFAKSDFIVNKITSPPIDYIKPIDIDYTYNTDDSENINNIIIPEDTPPDFGYKEDSNLNINGYTLSDIHFGNRVLLTNGLAGSIRFMGKVDFDDNIWLGIDLKKKNCNGNNGCAGGDGNRKYFEPKDKCGYFIRMNEIERILPSKSIKKKKKKKKKKRKCLKNFPKLGDKVKTVNGRIGVVEFIGVICLVKDICIGLTLDKIWPYCNDGSVKGKRYFTCEKGKGYFVRLQHLVENYGTTLGKNGQEKALEMGNTINTINTININNNNNNNISEINGNENEKEKEKEKEIIKFKNGLFQQGYYRIMEKLKEIEMLEERRRCGFFLFPTQFKKMEKKEEYLSIIQQIKNGTWIPPKNTKKQDDDKNDDDDDDNNNNITNNTNNDTDTDNNDSDNAK